jgi:predicted methyltransferase
MLGTLGLASCSFPRVIPPLHSKHDSASHDPEEKVLAEQPALAAAPERDVRSSGQRLASLSDSEHETRDRARARDRDRDKGRDRGRGRERDKERERSAAERIAAALAAPDRPAADAARDSSRHTAALLTLADVKPGERVIELGAGGGYMTWLYASLVGDSGAVTAQDPSAWAAQSAALRPMMASLQALHPNVEYKVMDFDQLDADAGAYDLVSMVLVYHEAVRLGTDRQTMLAQIYELLKPGGRLLVVDHAATPGSGEHDTASLRRTDPQLVREEVEAMGFKMVRESHELENPTDMLTLSIYDPSIRDRTSKFAMLFQKPKH